MDTLLFKPLKIRAVQLKNRIVLSPMLTYSAVKWSTRNAFARRPAS